MFNKVSYILNGKEKKQTILILIMIIAGSFLEMAAVAIFSPYIDLVMNPEIIESNTLLSIIYKLFGITDYTYFLVVLSFLIIAIYVVKDVYAIIEKNLIYKYSYRIQRRISTELLSSYMKEPYTFHLNNNISVLQRTIQVDAERFSNGLLHFMEMIAEIFVCIAIFIYLFDVSHSISVTVGGSLLICVGLFYFISKKYANKWGREGQQYNAKVYQWMNQSLGGVKELKVLNREQNFVSQFDENMHDYTRVMRYSRVIGVVPKYIIEMVSMSGMLLAVVIKLLYGQHRDFTVFIPQLAVFAVAAFRLLPSVGRINEHLSAFLYALPSLELIDKDIRSVENVEEIHGTRDEDWTFNNSIEIKHLTYTYPDSDAPVLNDVNLSIKKGQTVAFIGASGSGKSTLIDVILGLLIPVTGHILVDDMDIVKNVLTWQKEIGYIPQTIYLSDDTIRNNIAFGVPENEIDEDKITEALKNAQLTEFVESLPDGLETFVGDRGVRLSGGQRQRIGIARALYHNPAVLILDEATSALDSETEAAVMKSVDMLKGTKTILIIAHRLTTIQNADEVYEVTDGGILRRDKEEVLAQ